MNCLKPRSSKKVTLKLPVNWIVLIRKMSFTLLICLFVSKLWNINFSKIQSKIDKGVTSKGALQDSFFLKGNYLYFQNMGGGWTVSSCEGIIFRLPRTLLEKGSVIAWKDCTFLTVYSWYHHTTIAILSIFIGANQQVCHLGRGRK